MKAYSVLQPHYRYSNSTTVLLVCVWPLLMQDTDGIDKKTPAETGV
ncbi:MAG: hypothetical protein HWD58_14640 [Bacteroidota bacterium]|nr:MAG: hypothetical protein HWD58_14640 [Bacteroidota bacterium]